MKKAILLLAFLLAPSILLAADAVPTPESFIGHPVGADRKLAHYDTVLDYLRAVDEASDRVSIETAGESTLGNEMVTVVLTSSANQRKLARYREIARQLADPAALTAEGAEQLIAEGKIISLVTCTIHSTEVGCTQMAMEFTYDFATTRDAQKLAWMEDAILLLMPSINPDGQVSVLDWYDKYLGTEFEGGPMPWLYHHYVGHDNNRDFYMLTQKETRVVNDLLYRTWFPQVYVDEHQMGSTGPRMFVPPQADPLALEVDSLIFRQADLIGTNMSYRLEEAGKKGVGHNMIFDSYWPGGTRNTAWWKNVTGLLTEVASARIATPVYVDPGELRGGSKGLPEYKRQANFPSPWEGGWWRLRDIIDYELVATWALVETTARYRAEFLRNFYKMGRSAVEQGESEPPYAWIIAPEQHDPVATGRLIELLLRHGIRVERTQGELVHGVARYPAGTIVVPADQPYRAFLLTMLRPQRFPEIIPHVGGPVLSPYDVTSWSLPIAMGVDLVEADKPLACPTCEPLTEPIWTAQPPAPAVGGHLISHAADTAFTAINRQLARKKPVYWLKGSPDSKAGEIYLPPESATVGDLASFARELHLDLQPLDEAPSGSAYRVAPARVGLYKPWMASMDEGWTRWLLERYEFPYVNLSNKEISEGKFADRADVLLFPDIGKTIIEKGEPSSPLRKRTIRKLPPEYAGGLGEEGGEQLRTWVNEGGTIVALDSSTDYFIELFQLPIENVLNAVDRDDFNVPGSMLRILVDTDHPIGYGLREEEAAYFGRSPAFRTFLPDSRFERHVIARYPDHRDDIPLSGFVRGAERLERRSAVVEYKIGKGRVVLIGFRAQHRAQPLRTFKLLFNALYLPGLSDAEL